MNQESLTVLYVEDEENDVLFMYRAFARQGLPGALRSVPDGQAAIHYLSGVAPYDDRLRYPLPTILLLDLHLPLLSGFDVLQWTRAQLNFQYLPVVIFSSSDFETDRTRAEALGANDYWAKPSSAAMFETVAQKLRALWIPQPPLTAAGRGTLTADTFSIKILSLATPSP